MIEIEIERDHGLTRDHFSRNIFQQDEVKRSCHVECSNSNQHVGTTTVVNNFVENSKVKTCEDEFLLLQIRDDPFLVEHSAHV